MSRLRALFFAAFLCTFVAPAHIQTVSYPIFTIFEREVHALVRVKIAYFTDVMNFGVAGTRSTDTPAITPAIAGARKNEIAEIVTKSLHVGANGAPLETTLENLEFTTIPGEPAVDDVVGYYHFTCAEKIDILTIRYDLFAGHDPNHRGIAKIRRGVSEKTSILKHGDTLTLKTADIGPESAFGASAQFFVFGMDHIFSGYDHLMFLAGLLIAARTLKSLFLIVTAFTVTHSLSLVAAALDWVSISPAIVEPAIAASVLFVGLENLLRRQEFNKRWLIAGAFGLIHGLGFAGFVHEASLPPGARIVSLGSFNLGVEAGQATVICIVFPIIALAREKLAKNIIKYSYIAGSAAVAAAGTAWLVLRVI
ncbi:MAG: HupE/UreJ family protein [Planctomycetes bacterium]|nr:HupE/UreJ family protein [Planctomycetota bacterium]